MDRRRAAVMDVTLCNAFVLPLASPESTASMQPGGAETVEAWTRFHEARLVLFRIQFFLRKGKHAGESGVWYVNLS